MSDNRNIEGDLHTADYPTFSALINYNYCVQHNYDFKYYQPLLNGQVNIHNCISPNKRPRHASWSKILSCIKAIYDENKYEFILYIDSDCIFYNQKISLEHYLHKTKKIQTNNSIKPIEINFLNNKPWNYSLPCAGFFIFKPTTDSLSFFKDWYKQHGQYDIKHPWEQKTLHNYLYAKYNFKIINDWMFEKKSENQYLIHIGSTNSKIKRKEFFQSIVDTYNSTIALSHLLQLQKNIVRYDTSTVDYW
jgi:hypothetical protein